MSSRVSKLEPHVLKAMTPAAGGVKLKLASGDGLPSSDARPTVLPESAEPPHVSVDIHTLARAASTEWRLVHGGHVAPPPRNDCERGFEPSFDTITQTRLLPGHEPREISWWSARSMALVVANLRAKRNLREIGRASCRERV